MDWLLYILAKDSNEEEDEIDNAKRSQVFLHFKQLKLPSELMGNVYLPIYFSDFFSVSQHFVGVRAAMFVGEKHGKESVILG